MNRIRSRVAVLLTVVLLTVSWAGAASGKKYVGLANVVPDDVFLLTTERANPERDFLRDHWSEVGEALSASGLGEDVRALIRYLIGAGENPEFDEIEARVRELLNGVEWSALETQEVAFAERMNAPIEIEGKGIQMGPPDMLWIFQGDKNKVGANFEGLVNLLEGLVGEINAKIGEARLKVDKSERFKAEVASVDLLSAVENMPPMMLGVARSGDLIVIALGDDILDQALELAGGKAKGVTALGKDPRFRASFSGLPRAEDGLVYFDMQTFLASIRTMTDRIFDKMDKPKDLVINSVQQGEVHELNTEAWSVYEEGDYEKGLALVEEAYALAPDDSRVLYYLACFNALNGNDDEALDFLRRAVMGGFYSPGHISTDPDLASVRSDPRYEAALDRAREMAATHGSQWITTVRALVNNVMGAPSLIDHVAAVKYTEGLSLHTIARAELVSDAEKKAFYPVVSRRAHTPDFDRYLPQETESFTVSNGVEPSSLYAFYEEAIRTSGKEGEAMLEQWAERQKSAGFNLQNDVLAWIDGDMAFVSLENQLGWVLMAKVSDSKAAREKVSEGLGVLVATLAEEAKKKPALGMLNVRRAPVVNERLEDFENLFFAMSPTPVVWGVADEHLIFASSPEAVLTCLDTASGDHPGIRENSRVMSEMIVPKGPFTTVALKDQRALGDNLAKLVGMVTMGVNMAGMQAKSPQAREVISRVTGMLTKLSPVMKEIDFIKSTAALKTFDGKGWTSHQVTHFEAPADPPEPES